MSGATILSPASQTRRALRGLIILGLDIVLLAILLNTLPFDSKANMGLSLLVFIGVLWLTEAIHITITALLIPIMAVGMGLLEVNKALSSFSDPIIFLFFGGFALATALHIQQIDKLIANRILMLAKGKMLWASMLLFTITAAVSMWISNTATAAMMLPLAMGVLSKMDRNLEHNTYVFMLLGIAYSASIGGLGTLVGSPPNAIAAAQLGMNFWDWMKIGLPMMLVLMPIMIAVLYFVFRPNLQQSFEIELAHLQWTKPRIFALCIFALTAFCWIFSSTLWWP